MNVNNVETSFLDNFVSLITILFFHEYSHIIMLVLLPINCHDIFYFNKMH